MSVQGVDNLENLGRRQLQQLCKSFGIKANKKNVELIASLREVFEMGAPANQSPAASCQGNMIGSHVDDSSKQSSSQGSTKSPGTQSQDASESNQLNILQNDTTHPYDNSEGTVLVKNLVVGDEQAVLPAREHLGMSAEGAKDDEQQECLADEGSAAKCPPVCSSNINDPPIKRKRKGTDDTPAVEPLRLEAQSAGATAGDIQLCSPNDSKTDSEPPTKRKRKGTYEIPPEVSSLHMVQDPPAITYPIQSGESGMKEEILKEIFQRVARRREIGDVPKVVQKVPEKVQKNRHDWNKVHAKLFQKMESIDDYNARKNMAKTATAMATAASRIPISKNSSIGRQKENKSLQGPPGIFTFGAKKDVKPCGVHFNLAASLKKKPRSYTPYRGAVPKFVS